MAQITSPLTPTEQFRPGQRVRADGKLGTVFDLTLLRGWQFAYLVRIDGDTLRGFTENLLEAINGKEPDSRSGAG